MMRDKIYNLIFPTWLIIVNPLTGIPLLFLNYFVDRFVYWIVFKKSDIYKVKRDSFNDVVMYAFYVGLSVDVAGVIVLALTKGLQYGSFKGWVGPEVLITIALCGITIFYLNYIKVIKVLKVSKDVAYKLGFLMGILTAPWLFLLPPYYGQLHK